LIPPFTTSSNVKVFRLNDYTQILHRHNTLTIFDAIQDLNRELIDFITKHPQYLHQLTNRQFEKMVAEILANFGWEVELTQETKDGGYDIFGVSKSSPDGFFKSSYIVECKKYSKKNKIGVSVARELLQVKNDKKAANALLITTSDFTKGVYDYSINRLDFDVKNFDDIIEWCKYYTKSEDTV
jgi:restriction system protein